MQFPDFKFQISDFRFQIGNATALFSATRNLKSMIYNWELAILDLKFEISNLKFQSLQSSILSLIPHSTLNCQLLNAAMPAQSSFLNPKSAIGILTAG
jgi:hypothetical protein